MIPKIPDNWKSEEQKGLQVYTYSYYPYDQVRSALQKAIRRGDETTLLWFAEGYLTNNECKTNIWNGLLTIALEDVGLADVNAIYHIIQCMKIGTLSAGLAGTKYLVGTQKIRLNDIALHIYPEFNNTKYCQSLEDPQTLKQKLITSIKEKNIYHGLWYLKALFYTPEKVTGKYKNAQILIWDTFQGLAPDNKYVLALYELSMSTNWRWSPKGRLIHTHVFHLFIYDKVPNKLLNLKFEDIDVQPYLKREMLKAIPDYAIDKHTKAGRELGREIEHFMKEGSILHNEAEIYKVQSAEYLRLCKF
jgi:hypothetical protein